METLLTPEDVAAALQLPVATLYQQRYQRRGVGALAIRVGRHLRWRASDVESWLDQRAEEAKERR